MSIRILTPADEAAWREALPADRSAFGSVEFARFQERTGDGSARLILAETGGSHAAYPVLLRPVPFALSGDREAHDSATPPFTGPILLTGGDDPAQALGAEIAEALAQLGVVAEFAHMHPWQSRPELVGGAQDGREIVWVDLALDEERLWADSYTQARRNQVRQARRAGVVVREAAGLADVAEFHRVYSQTMERNEAHESYRYPLAYFEAFYQELPANVRFALAEHDGEVIAGGLYVHDRDDVYYFLGGADHAHQRLRPANAVIHETIRWARELGKRRLILGGGYKPGDGIMRFKGSFSPLRATLGLAQRIHRQADYDALVEAWRERHEYVGADPSFFPLYRATP